MIAHIFADRCVGCEACVTVCPTDVLESNPGGTPIIARIDQCQTCFMCELYCDSDAIYVGADQRQAEAVDPAAILASGQLGSFRRAHGWPLAEGTSPLGEFWRMGPLLFEGAQIAADRYGQRHPDWVPPPRR